MAATPDPPQRVHHPDPVIPAQRRPSDTAGTRMEPAEPGRRWPWAAGGLALGLLAGGAVGALAWSSTTVVASPPVERTITVTAPAPPPEIVTVTVPAPAPDPPAAAPPSAAPGSLTTFGDGVWEVGVDVAPGKYKTAGTDSYGCYYARLKANDGTVDDIISNGFGQGPVTVTVKPTDGYFETSGCVDWVRAG
jgi:hypothetical protein